MISQTSASRLDLLEQRLDEMQRRTLSSLAVTNPADGITYLRVADGRVQIFDGSGAPVLSAIPPPDFGYATPLQNYVAFPTSPSPLTDAFQGPFFTTATAVLYPNQPRLDITTSATLLNFSGGGPTGGIADWQLVYTVNGGSPVTVAASVGSTAANTTVLQSYTYLWPADYWGARIVLLFQARVRPGTGDPDFDEVVYAPVRLYGSPQ